MKKEELIKIIKSIGADFVADYIIEKGDFEEWSKAKIELSRKAELQKKIIEGEKAKSELNLFEK